MGGLGHSEVSSAWGIPSPSYIKSSKLHTTTVQMLFMEGQSPRPILPQGDNVVPPPHERLGLIQKVHLELGQFGVKRTYNLLVPHYHWKSMYAQVRDIITNYDQCDRVRTIQQFTLSPLPIQGMFYRWSCDLARELP